MGGFFSYFNFIQKKEEKRAILRNSNFFFSFFTFFVYGHKNFVKYLLKKFVKKKSLKKK
jgi:hypothetical protein